jgi:hypothetical protein
MQAESTSEPIGSPVPGVIPEIIRTRNPASRVLARFLSAIRGDKYMAGAYPPDWHAATPAPDAEKSKGRWVMRERHFPRLCHHCQAPMARQENTCWRCGTAWASEGEPQTTLRLIHGDAHTQLEDADRWTNEGVSFASEVPLPLPAIAATS